MKIIYPCLLILGLVGCATVNPTVATPNQVVIAVNAYNAAEVTGTNYLSLPLCVTGGTKVCRTTALSNSVVSAIHTARPAKNQLLADVASNVSAPISLFDTLIAAEATFQTLNIQ
jgi:hypothetical protein